jgi:tetratricopeptide (TPR) repeat protein
LLAIVAENPTINSNGIRRQYEWGLFLMQIDHDEWKQDPRNTDALFVLAAANTLNRQFRVALKCLDRLEELDPAYPGLLRLRAKIYELMGEHELAAKYWALGQDASNRAEEEGRGKVEASTRSMIPRSFARTRVGPIPVGSFSISTSTSAMCLPRPSSEPIRSKIS